MAGGRMGSGWYDLINNLTNIFGNDTDRKKFSDEFKKKHGKKGDGAEGGTTKPYKFGQFVDRHDTLLDSDNKRAQFLIDSGTRHWDPSIELLEYIIKQSLTRVDSSNNDSPRKIKFVSAAGGYNATKARAEIVVTKKAADGSFWDVPLTTRQAIDQVIGTDDPVTITVICPRENLRPSP
jgi:hypothetical protein